MNLCHDVKRIILLEKGLDLCSQLNLVLVWEDMADVFWQSVDVERGLVEINYIEELEINYVEELEHAGVLASGGYISMVDRLRLVDVDVSRIPANIVSNLVKIVKEVIVLTNVTGWSISMLNDAKCNELVIWGGKLESGSDTRPFMVSGSVTLQYVGGDIHGFMDNFDVDQKKSFLGLSCIDVSLVPHNVLNRFFKSCNGAIRLSALTGFDSSMLNGINCRTLDLYGDFSSGLDSKNMKDMIIEKLYTCSLTPTGNINGILDNIKTCEEWIRDGNQIVCMNEMLKSKVKVLLINNGDKYYKILSQYNGQGKCGEIIVERIKLNDNYFEHWANARKWKFEWNGIGKNVYLKRPQ